MRKLILSVAITVFSIALIIGVVYIRARYFKPVMNSYIRKNVHGSFAKLSQGETHYEIQGPVSGIPVILIHGMSVPYVVWDNTIQALAESGFRVVRYDLFGRGYSDRPRLIYNHELFIRQINELREYLEISVPAHIVGLSMGGAIAVSYTRDNPNRVRSLTLIDPAGPYLSQTARTERLTHMKKVFVQMFSSKDDQYQARQNKIRGLKKHIREQLKYRNTEWATWSIMRNRDNEKLQKAYETVGKRDFQSLLIWGSEDDVLPVRYAPVVKALFENMRMHIIPQTGHIPHYEKPGVVNPILIDFLRSVNE